MTANLTNPVFVSWYLAVIFLLGLLVSSAITVVPGGEGFVRSMMSVCLACALAFAFLALLLGRRARRGLDFGVFSSQSFRVAYAVIALIITLVLFMITGA